MDASLLLSMAGFALAMSITPGPVNLVALSTGAQYGFCASLRHVVGATLGFILLLLLMGLGLGATLSQWPMAAGTLHWGGILFLCYMAWQLVMDGGRVERADGKPPAFLYGALMQWLNPKAWLAASMGMGAYGGAGGMGQVVSFTALYLVICLGSIACWAYAGSCLQEALLKPRRLRWFNRAMALLLMFSAACLGLAEG
ncbi:LysE family translocator [Aeromonas eucrenophila]|uniref:LysE family translocator n=1 Tax=Aeromonas eucrenophila TaxID=649 RepID=A0ABW0Y6F6_9GAMM|nr:LysE family translocator [Aeromonas eucrenophila]